MTDRDHTGRFTKRSPAGQELQPPPARKRRAHPGEQLDDHRKSVRDHHRARFGGSKTVGELLREMYHKGPRNPPQRQPTSAKSPRRQ